MIDIGPKHLVTLCDLYATHRGVSHWRVSALVRRTKKGAPGDGQFFRRLRGGAECLTSTTRDVLQWFSDNWPADLPWPSDIPRPRKSKKEAA